MNLGGTDYIKVWTPWQSRFLWLPARIKIGDRAVYKWMWLCIVYYRTSSYSNLDDSDIDYIPAVVETEYAMNIFDILRSKD
jgi:hypothetical protein